MVLSQCVRQLGYWDALLLAAWKVNRGKGLFVTRHHLVNTSCQLWENDRAFWLFGIGQTSVWACQNWFCKESHSSGTERKTMGLEIKSQTLSREEVVAGKVFEETRLMQSPTKLPETARSCSCLGCCHRTTELVVGGSPLWRFFSAFSKVQPVIFR